MKKSVLKSVFVFLGVAVLSAAGVLAGQGSQAANESLWEASRAGDTTRITAALAQGADVNAKSRYDVTPLIFAAGNGRLDAVKLLLSRGADVNAQDTFYRATRGRHGHCERLYRCRGPCSCRAVRMPTAPLLGGVQSNSEALIKAALAGKVTRQGLAIGCRHGRHDEAGVSRRRLSKVLSINCRQ